MREHLFQESLAVLSFLTLVLSLHTGFSISCIRWAQPSPGVIAFVERRGGGEGREALPAGKSVSNFFSSPFSFHFSAIRFPHFFFAHSIISRYFFLFFLFLMLPFFRGFLSFSETHAQEFEGFYLIIPFVSFSTFPRVSFLLLPSARNDSLLLFVWLSNPQRDFLPLQRSTSIWNTPGEVPLLYSSITILEELSKKQNIEKFLRAVFFNEHLFMFSPNPFLFLFFVDFPIICIRK